MDHRTAPSRTPDRALRHRARRGPLGVAIIAALLVAVSIPTVAAGWDNYSFSSTDENLMVTLINQARASAGLPALSVSTELRDVARWRSKDMWDRNYFSHSIPSPPGGDVFDELHRRGICYTVAGENIGSNNYPDDVATQTMFNGWMGSSTHKGLILGSGFNRIGVGAFKGTGTTYPKHYWTAIFTHSCSSTATPTPAPTPVPTKTPSPTPAPTKTPGPTATPGPGATPTPRPTATPTPRPTATATPHTTPKPSSKPTATPDPTAEPSLEPTASPVGEPGPAGLALGGAVTAIWMDALSHGAPEATAWPAWPSPSPPPTEPPPIETMPPPATLPPDEGPLVTDADGGTLQVYDPPGSMSLLDTIVGDVVAAFLGS